jgi:ATP-dependent protease ClpP protease subunit
VSLDRLTQLAAIGRERAAQGVRRVAGDWYRISNAAGGRATVYIYGDIGVSWDGEGITAAQFVQDLNAVSAPAIDLHVNSPGGLVFDGIAIHAALRNHPATVDVYVDGLAASAASFIVQAGDTRTVEKPAKLMIHDAGGLVLGNSADMRQMADLLDELSDTIAGIYADRAGGSVESWRAAMRAETWYSAAQAVEAGLADAVAGSGAPSAASRRSQLIRARARVALGGV